MVVVLADHSMDWSLPHQTISLQPVFDADPLLAGKVRIAQNGGADLLYWTGPDGRRDDGHRPDADASRRPTRACWRPTTARPADRGCGSAPAPATSCVYCKAGWRFSDPAQTSNPIPGNHGHPATVPIPFFLAGGHPKVPRGATSSRHARTQDVAPTVAAFFGLGAPRGGWDGTARL